MEEPKKEESKALVRDTSAAGLIMEQVSHQRLRIERLLPDWMTVERFLTQVRLALTVGDPYKVQKLQECTPQSVVQAVLMAADLGLDPSGRLGSAYLVPYGQKCELIPGYRGLIDLAVRSGFVKSVNGWVVHEKDVFSPQNGKTPRHIPYLPKFGEDPDPGPVYAAWCLVQLRGGGTDSKIMSRLDIERIKDRSAAVQYARKNPGNAKAQQSPWFTDEEAMQIKTVIRRTLKTCPLSPTAALNATLERFSKAMDHDDEVEWAQIEAGDVEPAPKQSKTEQLKKDL